MSETRWDMDVKSVMSDQSTGQWQTVEQSSVYRHWEKKVPSAIKTDSVWKAEAYRLALFTSELAWHDVTKLLQDKRTISLADQLYRSTGAISADIEEGFSRGTGRDRARFYEYALGSAGKRVDGTSKPDTFLGMKWLHIAFPCSRRSLNYSYGWFPTNAEAFCRRTALIIQLL